MARQEFKQGETVMLHGYGTWKPAVVVNPDISKQESRWGWERGNHAATVHYVEVWAEGSRHYGGSKFIPNFRSYNVRNSRKDILGMAEYESTVVVKANTKQAERAERARQYEADTKAGLELAFADVVKAADGSDRNRDLRMILKLWIGDHELQRAGRLARKEGN